MSSRTIIIGAGIAGLSAAYHLDGDWELFEKEDEVGGMLRSTEIDGFTFDPACYVLHGSTPYTKNLMKALLGDNLVEHERSAWVYSHGVYTRYPFQSHLYGLPEDVIADCLEGLAQARPEWTADLWHWIHQTFGYGIAKHFMLPYNRKMWGVELRGMDYDWIEDRVAVPKFRDALAGAFRDTGPDGFGLNASFMYPKQGGIAALPKAMAAKLDQSRIHLSAEVTDVHLVNKVIETRQGSYCYEKLISTVPLDRLRVAETAYHLLHCGTLQSNKLMAVRVGVEHPQVSDKHWIYFPEDFVFHRVCFPSNFSGATVPIGCSSVVAEMTVREGDVDGDYIESAVIAGLTQLGILGILSRVMMVDVRLVSPAYPIHDRPRAKTVGAIKRFLRTQGVFTCGRWGDWEYDNIDQAILSGKRAAEEVNALQ